MKRKTNWIVQNRCIAEWPNAPQPPKQYINCMSVLPKSIKESFNGIDDWLQKRLNPMNFKDWMGMTSIWYVFKDDILVWFVVSDREMTQKEAEQIIKRAMDGGPYYSTEFKK